MPQSCCQTSQSHCPVACGPIKKFYDDYNVVFIVKVMPSSLLQSDGGAFIHMTLVGTYTIGSRVL